MTTRTPDTGKSDTSTSTTRRFTAAEDPQAPDSSSRVVETEFNYINSSRHRDHRESQQERTREVPVHSGGTVLLVDDNELVRTTVEMALGSEGFEVVSAVDGEEGWEVFRSDPKRFDLAIVDECMPGLSGTELYAKIHKLSPETKVIVTSGYFGDDFRAPVFDPRYATFLHKPFNIASLLSCIRNFIGDRRAAEVRPEGE